MNTKEISAITTKVCITPTSVGVAKYFIKSAAKGEPIIAPPPNPMMAMPAAMPRRSGHHLIGVDTGEISPRPSPIPPITPEPKTIIQNWCKYTPRAENNMPPHQHRADTTPTLRGPTRSSHPPQSEADDPSKTKNRMYIQPRVETFHSQVVVKSCAKISCLSHASEFLIPSALDNGSQNTENPWAMPKPRGMARAAGGTNHRLKPGPATMCSLSRRPGLSLGKDCSPIMLDAMLSPGCNQRISSGQCP